VLTATDCTVKLNLLFALNPLRSAISAIRKFSSAVEQLNVARRGAADAMGAAALCWRELV